MLVKFNPTLGTGNNSTTLYAYNFMRCVDAILTAGAGTTPVVRPLTAANTFDSSTNMITSVIANTEAGGWTRSSSYNLVDASYAATGITNGTYFADYYNNSGKADYPYKKFTMYTPTFYSSWVSHPMIQFRYGIHTATDYSGTAGYSNSTTSWTLSNINWSTYTINYAYGGLPFRMDRSTSANIGTALVQGMEFILAVTADYIILIEPLCAMIYCGIRTTQSWEDTYSNNPPVVTFLSYLDDRYLSYAANARPNTKGAWMLTRDGTGAIRAGASKIYQYWTENSGRNGNDGTDYVSGPYFHDISNGGSNVGINGCQLVGDEAGGPLFKSGYQYVVTKGSPGFITPPTTDSSGALVPPAYPVNVMVMDSSTVTSYTYINRGGRCLGIYKGMSGSDAYMNNYYTPGQIFTIDGDSYTPILTNGETSTRDMFLIRAK